MPLICEIKVIPSSGKSACKLDKNGMLKCYLKSPPENGKANAELIKLISKALGMNQNKVRIISGATTRNKRIQIDLEITLNDMLKKLGIDVPLEKQMGLF